MSASANRWVAFIAARLTEDERTARLAARMAATQQTKIDAGDVTMTNRLMPIIDDMLDDDEVRAYLTDPPRHAAPNDPDRMLREVAVKRSMLGLLAADARDPGNAVRRLWACELIAGLAAVYCDHPDHRRLRDDLMGGWRP